MFLKLYAKFCSLESKYNIKVNTIDVVLHEVAEEVQVNEELAETECKLLDEIASADHQLKVIRVEE